MLPTHAVAPGNSVSLRPVTCDSVLCPVAVWQGSCDTLKCVPFCSWFLLSCSASGHSKSNEDLRQQNSELEEKLRVLVAEKAAAQLGVEELQKKLEMSELLLQQVRDEALSSKAQAYSLWLLEGGLQPNAGQFRTPSCPV